MLPRHVQDVWADDFIINCNASGQGATVPCYSALLHGDHSWAGLAEATTRQDEGYVVDPTPCGRIDKAGHAGHCWHHHYSESAFNALYTI
jgi:hypothetical protein